MKEPPFINREIELKVLLNYAKKGYYPVLYLYGPEGCGKTRLLKEVVKRLQNRKDYLIVYIDAQSTSSIENSLLAPSEIVRVMADIIGNLTEPIGKLLAYAVVKLSQKLSRRQVRDKRVVILIDDVARPLGLDVIEVYAKNLLKLIEELYSLGVESVFVLATTSEGISRRLLARHNYTRLRELWNLSPQSTQELLKALEAPPSISNRLYSLTGGNPRSIIELWRKNWKVKTWIQEIEFNLKPFLEDLPRDLKEKLVKVIEDIDLVLEDLTLRDRLLEANLIAPIDRPCLGYTPEVNKELGIGEYYAWQIPVYKQVLCKLLSNDRN